MDLLLKQLADKLGILTEFYDGGLNRKDYQVDESAVKQLAKSLGFKAGNVQEIAKSLEDFDKRPWLNTLSSIYVVNSGNVKFSVILPQSLQNEKLSFRLYHKKSKKKADFAYNTAITGQSRKIGKTDYVKLEVSVTTPLEIGYYTLELSLEDKTYKSVLAVAPESCYENPFLKERKMWGFAAQLYSLKSERNWGVGDFTDLGELVKISSRAGADIIALNPLSTLHHNNPAEASPYFAISRLFLNPIYIDVEAVPEFKKSDIKGKNIKALRDSELIDYVGVYSLKMEILKILYLRFKENEGTSRHKEFTTFCNNHNSDLDNLVTFQSLYEDHFKDGFADWHLWEDGYKDLHSLKIKKYVEDHQEKINFFKYLQFEADRQFKDVFELVKKSGLKIGLYRDLPVGVSEDSVEVWQDTGLFIREFCAGAPPDAFFPSGQKWGLGAYNPFVLKEQAYEPFIKILRANMKNAGALRIDHVMSLMRLFVIGDKEHLSTYIKYNFDDMLNLVALESHLHQCIVVGESIGNIPEGFLEKISAHNINALSVLWAERWDMGWGNFKNPDAYPHNSFCSVGTHDMAPLRMWWFGYDITECRHYGFIESDDAMRESYRIRELDRWKLLSAMDSNSVWPKDRWRQGNYIYGEGYPEGIEEAVHRFLSRSESKVFLAEMDNILHVDKRQNLPGTTGDTHPNWCRKMPVNLENLETDEAYIRNTRAIKQER